MAIQDEVELDMKLGEAHEEIKRLRKKLLARTEELHQLRRALDSIHALSNKSVYSCEAQRVIETNQTTGEAKPERPTNWAW
jgi:predicted RNase H-like nuclease (RuvC/YqgF family)